MDLMRANINQGHCPWNRPRGSQTQSNLLTKHNCPFFFVSFYPDPSPFPIHQVFLEPSPIWGISSRLPGAVIPPKRNKTNNGLPMMTKRNGLAPMIAVKSPESPTKATRAIYHNCLCRDWAFVPMLRKWTDPNWPRQRFVFCSCLFWVSSVLSDGGRLCKHALWSKSLWLRLESSIDLFKMLSKLGSHSFSTRQGKVLKDTSHQLTGSRSLLFQAILASNKLPKIGNLVSHHGFAFILFSICPADPISFLHEKSFYGCPR